MTSAINTSDRQNSSMATNMDMDTRRDVIDIEGERPTEDTKDVVNEDTKDGVNGNLYDVYTTFNLDDNRPGNTTRSNSIIFKSKEFLTLAILILIVLTSIIALISEYKKWRKWPGCKPEPSQLKDDFLAFNMTHPRP